MQFDAVLSSIHQQHIDIPAGWAQGRATFGGLVAALMYHELQRVVPGRVLRSLTVSFVGPVATGAADFRTEVLRSGKSVTQAECRLLQNGEIQAVLLASFGEPRESVIQVPGVAAPVMKSPDEGLALPYIPGLTPEFTQHFDFRWSVGGLPFSGSDSADIGGWMRFRQADGAMQLPHLLALVDVWPPSVLSMLKTMAPGSSLTWTLELVGALDTLQASDWLQYLAQTEYAADGYAHIASQIWDASGRLLAISRQTAVVFA